jgi:hypothetical protein
MSGRRVGDHSKTTTVEAGRSFMRKISISVFVLAASVMVPASAMAQMTWTDKGYVSATVGGQAGSRTLTSEPEYTLYDEPGTLATSQKVGGGAFVDFGGGYKVWHNLVLGISYSHVGSSTDAVIAAQVPDPAVFDRPRAVTTTLPDADYSENSLHFSAVWMIPVTDTIDVGLAVGPSVFMVKQDLPTGLNVTEPGPTVTSVISSTTKKTVGGFHAGVDVTYLLTKKIGAGLLARYTFGSVDFPGATDSLTVGGFQFGLGLRYRF